MEIVCGVFGCMSDRDSGPHTCDREICKNAAEHHVFDPTVYIGNIKLDATRLRLVAAAMKTSPLMIGDEQLKRLEMELLQTAAKMEVN